MIALFGTLLYTSKWNRSWGYPLAPPFNPFSLVGGTTTLATHPLVIHQTSNNLICAVFLVFAFTYGFCRLLAAIVFLD